MPMRRGARPRIGDMIGEVRRDLRVRDSDCERVARVQLQRARSEVAHEVERIGSANRYKTTHATALAQPLHTSLDHDNEPQ